MTATTLHAGMDRDEIAGILDKLIFTAARNWERSIKIDSATRDTIVHALRAIPETIDAPKDL